MKCPMSPFCNCDGTCLDPRRPKAPTAPHDRGEAVIAWAWGAALFWMVLLAALVLLSGCASTPDDIAWKAYHHRSTPNADGVWDCDDHALYASRQLRAAGIPAVIQSCDVGDEGHVYVALRGGGYIDNKWDHVSAVTRCNK